MSVVQGLEAVGGRCVFASERDAHACTTYHANFGDVPFGDITEIDTASIPPHDLLTAGFPCQSFSKAGAINEAGRQGLGDSNGQLFFEVVRVLEALRPAGFLLENVAELLSHDEGRSYAVVDAALRVAGYRMESRVINSLSVLPQHRERLYLIGVREDLAAASAPTQTAARGRFAWPPVLQVAERCESGERFGRRCPCRRLDVSSTPAMRGILQSAAELEPEVWLTAAQWGKIARKSPVTPVTGGSCAAGQTDGAAAAAACGVESCEACRRLAWVDGAARTLMSSYRRGFEMYSEFVPHSEEAMVGGGAAALRP